MTQDEIIEMAVQAGIAEEIAAFNIPIIEIFAKLVAAKAIAELESQEPWCMKMNGCTAKCEDCPDQPPLTPQRTWVGLTDEEIEQSYETTGHYQKLRSQDRFAVYALARAVEAKLKELNT